MSKMRGVAICLCVDVCCICFDILCICVNAVYMCVDVCAMCVRHAFDIPTMCIHNGILLLMIDILDYKFKHAASIPQSMSLSSLTATRFMDREAASS